MLPLGEAAGEEGVDRGADLLDLRVEDRVLVVGRALEAQRLDGRLLVMLSTDPKTEPRFQIADGPETQLVFGIDVDGLAPGTPAIVDASAFGYPIRSLRDVPP